MTNQIILSLVALLMLALSFKKGDKRTSILTLGLTLGILITWIRVPEIATLGILIYMFTALAIALLHIKNKELSKLNQVAIILSGFWAFGVNLFSLIHWPFAEQARISMLLPLLFYSISLFYGMIKRKEFGYMTILNVEFVLRFI